MSAAEAAPLLQAQSAYREELHPKSELESSQDDAILQSQTDTRRTIGWSSAYILSISRVIGSGIFAMPGTILQDVGSPGLALLLWVVGAFIAWCGLTVDIEYGCMFPRSGGMKVYLEYTYPRPRFLTSTLVAVHAVLLGFTASNCIVFAKYILFAADVPVTDFDTKALAVGLLTVITVLHGCFYRTGVAVQNVLGWLKVGLILVIIVTGVSVLLFGLGEAQGSELHLPNLWNDSDWHFSVIATAILKIFYSYAGLSNINNVLNEVKNPVATLKTVGPITLVTACALYVLINVAYLAVVPLSSIKQSRELIAALFFDRVFGTQVGGTILPVAIALSAAGNVMVVTFSLARLNQEIARSGFLPYASVFASSRPFGTPLGGLIVHYVPSLLVIVLPPSAIVYAFIANVEAYAGQFFALAVAIGLLVLRRRKPKLDRPYTVWMPTVWLRILLCVALIAAPLFPVASRGSALFQGAYALVGMSVLLFGLVYWYAWTRLLPRIGRYTLEEQFATREDGVPVKRLVRQPASSLNDRSNSDAV